MEPLYRTVTGIEAPWFKSPKYMMITKGIPSFRRIAAAKLSVRADNISNLYTYMYNFYFTNLILKRFINAVIYYPLLLRK